MPFAVKICCIQSIGEAAMALAAGASHLGLVSAMPSGPGVVNEARIAEVAAWAPPTATTVLLTSQTTADAIASQHRRCRTGALQLCDRCEPRELAALRRALPAVELIQVIHVEGEEAVEEARAAAPRVDALLLDSGRRSGKVKELGGTGRVHDWEVSRRIVATSPRPVFLAGGLRPENVAAAVRAVQPAGVDVCTGVRTEGALDEARLGAFFRAVHSAGGN